MEINEAAALIGTGLATFAASWVSANRSIKARAAEPRDVDAIGRKLDELRDQVGELRTEIVSLKTRMESLEKAQEKSERLRDRLEERLAKTVTDEEFGAYTHQTTTMIQGLTERVGRAIGVLDGIRD